MKKLLVKLSMLGLIILSGCVTSQTQTKTWVSNRAGQDFNTDNYECVQQSRTSWSGGGTGLIGVAAMASAQSSAKTEAERLYKMCMESKGYVLTEKEKLEEQKRQLERELKGNPNLGTTGLTLNIIEEVKPVVLAVRAGSPATLVGIRPNDIIIEKNGKRVSTVGELKAMPWLKAGDWVEYRVLRGTQELVFKMQAVKIEPDLPTKPQVIPPEKPAISAPVVPSSGKANIVTVVWTFANIRSGAGNDYPVVITVKQGDKLTVIGEYSEWFNVRLEGGQQGWISNRVVK
jgi:C-terminal processing protease CtpA/Prc